MKNSTTSINPKHGKSWSQHRKIQSEGKVLRTELSGEHEADDNANPFLKQCETAQRVRDVFADIWREYGEKDFCTLAGVFEGFFEDNPDLETCRGEAIRLIKHAREAYQPPQDNVLQHPTATEHQEYRARHCEELYQQLKFLLDRSV